MIPDEQWQSWIDRIRACERTVNPIATQEISLDDLENFIMTAAEQRILQAICESHQDLLSELIEAYTRGTEEERATIRDLFVKYRYFAWAVSYRMRNISNEELRRYFVYLSMLDQGQDTRDYLLEIRHIVNCAKKNHLNYKEIMAEVSLVSSTENRFGWGTTRQILLDESRS